MLDEQFSQEEEVKRVAGEAGVRAQRAGMTSDGPGQGDLAKVEGAIPWEFLKHDFDGLDHIAGGGSRPRRPGIFCHSRRGRGWCGGQRSGRRQHQCSYRR